MGEYAMYAGNRVKIGTCEDMYYLRAEQASLLIPEPNSLDPADSEVQEYIRFRFPWPDEDEVEPGDFDAPDRAHQIYGVTAPSDVGHYLVQFISRQAGYITSIPCPESVEGKQYQIDAKLIVHRNGFGGAVKLSQQAWRNGKLVIIAECGGCHVKWNVPTLADANPYIESMLAQKELEIARRIVRGYTVTAEAGVA